MTPDDRLLVDAVEVARLLQENDRLRTVLGCVAADLRVVVTEKRRRPVRKHLDWLLKNLIEGALLGENPARLPLR